MFAILDCGTTNTKCYIVTKQGAVIGERHGKFGVKDNSLKINIDEYRHKLKVIVEESVSKLGKKLEDLNGVIGFGMISSDLGIVVVPHSVAPVSLQQLQSDVYDATYQNIFGLNIPFYLIRGIKNALPHDRSDSVLDICDFMRGEETQITGIIKKYCPSDGFNTIVLSSHLKIIHTDKNMCIDRSMTTISGQIFDCILHHTSVGKSIAVGDDATMNLSLEQIVELAERISNNHGLTRALLIPRFMESFTDMSALERRTYLDAVMALEDMKAIKDYVGEGSYATDTYYLVGHENRCKLLSLILKKYNNKVKIQTITGNADIRDIAVIGARIIVQKLNSQN